MPFIRNLWVASLTDNAADSDTDNRRVVMMTQVEIDVLHDDLDSRPADRGGGNVDHLDISDFGILPENYYMRIGIRGDDAWRPTMIAAWSERSSRRPAAAISRPPKTSTSPSRSPAV